eukprot:CAMPEP_0185827128 /NCGR_PEP_ID=MMETSP1322-20130828/31893_1 /TAXON_ID=265543 /ORGANISM="Minutocellus polymorphus, Strain RCC2270" /LENGTH=862 /DNA_ID=CAMNT_0028524859 /DNA_START=250 /DNA_END=2838 /DNA_ORIENTATION=-
MKFGATLEQSVADDWRGYAVDYSSLKLALKGQRRTAAGTGVGGGAPPPPPPPLVSPAAAASHSGKPPLVSPSAAASHSGKPPLSPMKKSAGAGTASPGTGTGTGSSSGGGGGGGSGVSVGHRRVPSALRMPTIGDAASTAKTERANNVAGHHPPRDRTVSWEVGKNVDAIIGADDDVGLLQQKRSAEAPCEITKEDIDAFNRIFQNSQDRLEKFHDDKRTWALERMAQLEAWVGPPSEQADSNSASGEPSSETGPGGRRSSSAVPPEELRKRINDFDAELDRIIEFLQINQTAFSKILKKFDKNTGLKTREAKLGEMKLTHGFFDGAVYSELKGKVQRLRLKAIAEQNKVEDQRAGLGGEGAKPSAADIVKARRKRIEALNIARAERYLRKMEVGSEFFAEHDPRQLPQFTENEVDFGKKLGQGEFANVKEVSAFKVKESCHLCFFHRNNGSTQGSTSISGTGIDTTAHSHEEVAASSSLPESSVTGEETKEEPGTPNTNNNGAASGSCATQDSGNAPANPPTKLLAMPEVGTGGNYLEFDDNVSDYDELEDDHNEELLENRGFMKDHCFREGSPRYAVKLLRGDLDSDTKREAALDFAIEAKFLATLSHPNIIKQRGTSGVPGHSQFFIILDKLNITLTEKRMVWRDQKMKAKRGPFGFRKDRALLKTLWVERLTAAYDVARALKYLHENNIVYRDLKPDNCGFDIRNDVKVFDFGLAKELTARDRVGLDQYKASGLTGSRRYMAPEVVLCKPYGLSVDVFSFGIFLWELLAMKEPFEDYDVHKHARLVVKKGRRPMMKTYWPGYVKQLMESCWATDPRARPTFAEIYQMIKNFPEMCTSSLSMTERTRMLMDRSVTSLYR